MLGAANTHRRRDEPIVYNVVIGLMAVVVAVGRFITL